jgi:2-oxoisovalerate dehydrogenase E1 component beta subunit
VTAAVSQTTTSAPTWFEPPTAAPGPRAGELGYLDAITAALDDELATDERVVLLGEDIGAMGGAFRATRGLFDRYGPDRVIDTPLAETAIVGAAIGMAICGLRPIVELQFADFISCAFDQLVTEAAKLHYRFGISVPVVVRAPSGAGVGAGPFHSTSPEGFFAHAPGLRIVCPATVQDAYDLLRQSVADPNPVLYFEHKALYRRVKGPFVRRQPADRLGGAVVRRPGRDLTFVAYGASVHTCLTVAAQLVDEDIEAEVVDLRTLVPLDMATVADSVERTARVVIVHEDTRSSGIGAEIAARLAEERVFDLDAPIIRVTGLDTPVPFAKPLEDAFLPGPERVLAGAHACLAA